jgi:hypothetical protein
MLYPLELRALNNLGGTDCWLFVKLHAVGSTLPLIRSNLRSLGKRLLVFYQAVCCQIAVAMIYNLVAPIYRIRFSVHHCHRCFPSDSVTWGQ